MQKKGAALRAVQDTVLRQAQDEREPGAGKAGAKDTAPALAFTPVPRRYRHDGWTPERQKAFIEGLADTGCVSRAARMVNMAQANCYTLRRAPGAESFRRAWDAALDFGVKHLKDIAFERAIEGYLVPVFVAGKLMGFRRRHNDALLMFCLRHYGQDEKGRRVTVNYFSSRASAGAVPPSAAPPPPSAVPLPQLAGGGLAEASTTTVRTVITGSGDAPGGAERDDAAAGALQEFEGVALDAEAEAAIRAALEACAARAREAQAAYAQDGEAAVEAGVDDPDNAFVRVLAPPAYHGELEPPGHEEFIPFTPGEAPWELAGLEMSEERARIEEAAERADAERRAEGGCTERKDKPSCT
ncbi:MAG TPA: hypothetical protein VHM92_12685 [Allosphingosinicella sp.]|nr:hypothetical protein [Allosphingosinicella sp.]